MFSEQSTTRTRNRITPRRTACTWAGTKQHRQRRHLRGHAGGRDHGRECTRAARAAAWGYLTVSATPRSRAAVLRAGFLITRSSPFSSSRKRSSGISCICMGPDHRAILRRIAHSPVWPGAELPCPLTNPSENAECCDSARYWAIGLCVRVYARLPACACCVHGTPVTRSLARSLFRPLFW